MMMVVPSWPGRGESRRWPGPAKSWPLVVPSTTTWLTPMAGISM